MKPLLCSASTAALTASCQLHPRLAGTRRSVSLLPRSIESSMKDLAAVEKAAATLSPMLPVLAVKLAALCSNESSAGQL